MTGKIIHHLNLLNRKKKNRMGCVSGDVLLNLTALVIHSFTNPSVNYCGCDSKGREDHEKVSENKAGKYFDCEEGQRQSKAAPCFLFCSFTRP